MASRFLLTVTILYAGLMAACVTAGGPEGDMPAVINQGDMAMLDDISGAISGALGGRRVMLARDTLAYQSDVTIDPAFVTDRSFARPDHFSLALNNGRCVLIHHEGQRRYPLRSRACAPARR
ncbi:MAG: hypothetical protein V3U82_09295 [Robiginitomaculum sp.]